MKNNISLSDIGSKLSAFLQRYGVFVFFLIVAGGLISAIFLLNIVITRTDEADGYVSDVNNISFDKETIDKIRALRSSDQQTAKVEDATGRILPF